MQELSNELNKKSVFTPSSIMLMAVLGGAFFFSNFHRLFLSVLGDIFVKDFGLTDAQFGMLGACIYYSYGILQFPAGVIADYISAKKIIAGSCLLTGVAAIMFATSTSFSGLVFARILTGLGTAFVYVPGLTIIRKTFGDAVFGVMGASLGAMGQIGAISSSAPLRYMAQFFRWDTIFIFLGVVSMVLAVFAWVLIKDHKDEPGAVKGRMSMDGIREALSPGGMALMLWFFTVGGTRLSFLSLWAGRYYTQAIGADPGDASIYLMAISIGNVIGAVLVGRLSDRFGGIRVGTIGNFVITGVWLSYMMLEPGAPFGIVLALSFANGLFGSVMTAGYSSIKLFVGKKNMGFVTGIYNSAFCFGSVFFTQADSYIMDMSGSSDQHARFVYLFKLFMITTIVSGIIFGWTNRSKFTQRMRTDL